MKTFAVVACLVFVGCASNVQFQSSRPHPALAGIKTLHLRLDVVSGGSSTSQIEVDKSGHSSSTKAADQTVMDGKEHAELVAKDMTFELGLVGLTVADDKSDADANAAFSIGAVRFLGGQWVADQAFLELKDAKTDQPICSIRADAGDSPMPVKDIVRLIARRLAKEK
jgi:hypothetical protein